MVIACIDIGTNTALLLIAEVGSDGVIHPLYDEQRFVRLGEGVDASGRVRPEAMERLRKVLLAYRKTADEWSARDLVLAGTSASRDASNREDLVSFVRVETGLAYEILSGDDEAYWTFLGALSAFDDLVGPVLVVDVGGGSTEIVVGERQAGDSVTIHYQQSIDVGAVRLTERIFSDMPPARGEVEEMERVVKHAIETAGVPAGHGHAFVAAAGTASALALVHSRIKTWDENDVASVSLLPEEIHAWRERLLSLTRDQILQINPGVLAGRADVFPAGVLILETVLRHTGATRCRISPRGLRHGLALRYVRR